MRKKKPAKKKRALAQKTTNKKKTVRRKTRARPAHKEKDSSAIIHQGVGLPKSRRAVAAIEIVEDDVTSEYGGES